MSQNAHVVDGEASESDSEIELAKSPDVSGDSKAFVISGEAPESDDESKLSNTVSNEKDIPLNTSTFPSTPASPNYVPLLNQKLYACNTSIRASMVALLEQTSGMAASMMAGADKSLLNVQESMRATNANLTLARARLKQLQGELEKANCSGALPTVKIR